MWIKILQNNLSTFGTKVFKSHFKFQNSELILSLYIHFVILIYFREKKK